MNLVETAGGIVTIGDLIVVNTRDSGLFAIPKGHRENAETIQQTAIREVYEETGIEPVIIRKLGIISRESTERSGETVDKNIHVFLMNVLRDTDLIDYECLAASEPNEGLGPALVTPDIAIANMHHAAEAAFLQTHFQPQTPQVGF